MISKFISFNPPKKYRFYTITLKKGKYPGQQRSYRAASSALETIPGALWRHLELSGAIWSYLALPGAIWGYLELPGAIWRLLELSGAVGKYLELSAAIWSFL